SNNKGLHRAASLFQYFGPGGPPRGEADSRSRIGLGQSPIFADVCAGIRLTFLAGFAFAFGLLFRRLFMACLKVGPRWQCLGCRRVRRSVGGGGARPMSWLRNVGPIARALRALERRAQLVWSRDRSSLRGAAALANRAFRIAILTVRGIVTHRLGLQTAALTYYSVFAMVPALVVALWIMKWFDRLPVVSTALPGNVSAPTGNQLFHAAVGMILDAVGRTSEIGGGVVGLAVMLFAVSKMFGYTERALHIIAASGERTPRFSRALSYLAMLLIPPVAVAVSGLLLALLRRGIAGPLFRFVGAIPGIEIALGVTIGLGALWLAVTLLYAAAARARIAFRSAALGGAVAALALPVVFWVFASLQIGVSHASAVGSGFFALPV